MRNVANARRPPAVPLPIAMTRSQAPTAGQEIETETEIETERRENTEMNGLALAVALVQPAVADQRRK